MVKYRFKSLRTRTMVTILPWLILSIFILSTLSYRYSKNLINAEIQEKMEYKLSSTINSIQTLLTAHSKIPESMARSIEVIGTDVDKDKYYSIIQGLLTINPDTFGVGVWYEPYQYKKYLKYYGSYAFRNNGQISFSEDYSTEEYNYPQKDWYLIGKDTKQTVMWTDPYYDKNSNATILTTTAPFYNADHSFHGVVTANINLTDLQHKISDIHVGKGVWAFLLDQKGNYIASKDNQHAATLNIKDDPNVSLAQNAQEMLTHTNGNSVFSDDKGLNKVFYQTVPYTSWKLALVISEKELYQKINEFFIVSLVIISLLVCFVVLVIYFYSRYITNNLKKVNILSQCMSEGDLTQTITINSVDEFGQMANHLNSMSSHLKRILSQVLASAKSVSDTSFLLSANSEQSAKATEEIAHSMQEIAGGTHIQLSLTNEAAEATTEMFENIKQIKLRIEHTTKSSNDALHKAHAGNTTIAEAINQINLISRNSFDSVTIIQRLEEKSQKINQMMNLLSTIAKQTKILALNAGVIAAEASSNGKAFAVISSEIRHLAENSTKFSHETRSLVSEIQADISKAVKGMGTVDSSIQKGNTLTNLAGDSFISILRSVEDVSDESNEMRNEIKVIHMNMQKMIENMEVVSKLYEKSAESTLHVSATTEQQTAASEEVASFSNELAHMAKVLQESLAHFKLE